MNKLFTTLIFSFFTLFIKAQAPLTQPFGKIDTADLKLTSCDFENDANAMVLFDKAKVIYKYGAIMMERHKRIKIFNSNAKEEGNIKIEFYGGHHNEEITDVIAETINLDGKTIEYTPVDKKLIYNQVLDKQLSAIVFTFPNVRAGSVIEFEYKFKTPYPFNYPNWTFQNPIPTRYSEFDATFDAQYPMNIYKKIYQPLLKDSSMSVGPKKMPDGHRYVWAMGNVKTYKIEPYMDSPEEYLQCILFKRFNFSYSWKEIATKLLADPDFGGQLNKHENDAGYKMLVEKAKQFKTTDEKIAYLFNAVKNSMKWNYIDLWYTLDGVKKAWAKKSGTSTEINLILYTLLKEADVNALLLTLRTKEKGRLDTGYMSLSLLNKTVVYYPIDSAKYYVLDASNKYSSYNQTPFNLMGLTGLKVDTNLKSYKPLTLPNQKAREGMLINAIIGDDGTVQGSFGISSSNYSREKYLKQYGDLGEKEYVNSLQKENNGLKISSFKLENQEDESVPLMQTFEFNFNGTGPDGDYLYINPNQFTSFHKNPFLSETRVSNIDFGGLYNYTMNGTYKIPAGYKINILPKSIALQMPDKSILFKRSVAEQDGNMLVSYTIDYKRAAFTNDEYGSIHDFFKKMYEMLNEPIVLKKI